MTQNTETTDVKPVAKAKLQTKTPNSKLEALEARVAELEHREAANRSYLDNINVQLTRVEKDVPALIGKLLESNKQNSEQMRALKDIIVLEVKEELSGVTEGGKTARAPEQPDSLKKRIKATERQTAELKAVMSDALILLKLLESRVSKLRKGHEKHAVRIKELRASDGN